MVKVIKKISDISSYEKLLYLREQVQKVDCKRVEFAINSMTRVDDMDRLLRLFSNFSNDLVIEHENLLEESETHNKKYATDCNGRFNMTYDILCNIKTSIYGVYKIVIVCSDSHSTRGYYTSATDMSNLSYKLEHSTLGNLPIQMYLFDNKTPAQKRLITEIHSFITYLENALTLCLEMTKEELAIVENDESLKYLIRKQIDELYEFVKNKSPKDDKLEPWMLELADYENHPQTLKEHFHKEKPQTLQKVAIVRYSKRCSKFSKAERTAFHDDFNQMEKNRKVIRHVPEFFNKVTGDAVYYTMRYMNYTGPVATYNKCFHEAYTAVNGSTKGVTPTAVSNAMKKYNKEIDTDKYTRFELHMDCSV